MCQGKLGTRWCLFEGHFSGDLEGFGVEGGRGRFQRFAKARQAFWRLTGAHQFLPPPQKEENAGSIQQRFQPERKGFFVEGFVPTLWLLRVISFCCIGNYKICLANPI